VYRTSLGNGASLGDWIRAIYNACGPGIPEPHRPRCRLQTERGGPLIIWTIPYFDTPDLGPIEPWGLCVATGVIVGLIIGTRRAERLGLDTEAVSGLAAWFLMGGFVGARLMHVFAYRWVDYADNLWEIPMMWKGGMSSYGGFIGAAIAGIVYIRRTQINLWRYGDLVSYGFMPGWTIGRIGCFLIHDHPGAKSDFFLAVEMRVQEAGQTLFQNLPIEARHDLGLYDGILSLCMWIIFAVSDRKPRFSGFYLGAMCALYSIPRFFLDFLRATDLEVSDTRYGGLTPAQYGSIILLFVGAWILWKRRNEAPGNIAQ